MQRELMDAWGRLLAAARLAGLRIGVFYLVENRHSRQLSTV
jgi:hypothetical protein